MASAQMNTNWFQKQFLAKGYTQRKIAKSLKMFPSALSRLLKGERLLQLEEAVILADLLGVTLEEVLKHAGVERQAATKETLPITGWVDGSLKVQWGVPKGPRTAPYPAFGSKDTSVLRLQTAGSSFEGIDGALVYFQPQKTIDPDAVGRLSVVKLAAGRGNGSGSPIGDWRLGVVKRGYSTGTYNLASMAGELMAEDVRLESASPVIWLKF